MLSIEALMKIDTLGANVLDNEPRTFIVGGRMPVDVRLLLTRWIALIGLAAVLLGAAGSWSGECSERTWSVDEAAESCVQARINLAEEAPRDGEETKDVEELSEQKLLAFGRDAWAVRGRGNGLLLPQPDVNGLSAGRAALPAVFRPPC
jgi:hypothetical protein